MILFLTEKKNYYRFEIDDPKNMMMMMTSTNESGAQEKTFIKHNQDPNVSACVYKTQEKKTKEGRRTNEYKHYRVTGMLLLYELNSLLLLSTVKHNTKRSGKNVPSDLKSKEL